MAIPLTANAKAVLEARYLLRDERGVISETPEALFWRVARAVAEAESPRGNQRKLWARRFHEMMASLRFLPNSPTLMNAGKPQGQLSACFVLPVSDSLDGIFTTLRDAALIQQSGGGTGFSFSRLRPRGARVRSSQGAASGPVGFIRVFDAATEAVKQGGARRGANMAVLRVDHPDIREFVLSKRSQKDILNFNLSVGITEKFMRALEAGDEASGKLFDEIVQCAWECGDPGVVFLDRIGLFNPTPTQGEMESTNPCGEQPLLSNESCNLGSLNLGAYFRRNGGVSGAFDWKLFQKDIHSAVRFLDDVIEVNAFPLPETRKITRKNRKIGLGVMGFADLLLKTGIPYGAPESFALGEKIMAFVDREGKRESARLAQERGAFPSFKGSLWDKLGFPKLRNATVTTVAPTGTISIIAGVSSGIEPIFSGVFYRNVLDGGRLLDVHPAVAAALGNKLPKELSEAAVARALGPAWTPAPKVPVEAHVRMQAVFQRHCDSAVSKTINLPREAKPSDVAKAYRLAYELGCKGITIYRDQSRAEQVLERPAEACPACD